MTSTTECLTIDYITIDDARDQLKLCDSYSRLPALLDMTWDLNTSDFFTLLGEVWPMSDNIGWYIDELVGSFRVVGAAVPASAEMMAPEAQVISEMMTPEAQAIYDSLPDEVTIYRGCYASNMWGLSWSLRREVAERFPTLPRYRQPGQPILVTAKVMKKDIIAIIANREEYEIVAYMPGHVSTHPIHLQD